VNFYVVTEGLTEKKVYPYWIRCINPEMRQATSIDDVTQNSFYLISARGYPQLYEAIESGIEDVNVRLGFDRLVISVDSDEDTFEDRFEEISAFVQGKNCRTEIRIIVQHFCFETWALGNRTIFRKHPQDPRIRRYLNILDVRSHDPALLPPNDEEDLNRAQFAEKYLKAGLNDRYTNLTYKKSNPTILLNEGFFSQVKNRLHQTGHISSFSTFLDAFS
jgi:hypothetical protein